MFDVVTCLGMGLIFKNLKSTDFKSMIIEDSDLLHFWNLPSIHEITLSRAGRGLVHGFISLAFCQHSDVRFSGWKQPSRVFGMG